MASLSVLMLAYLLSQVAMNRDSEIHDCSLDDTATRETLSTHDAADLGIGMPQRVLNDFVDMICHLWFDAGRQIVRELPLQQFDRLPRKPAFRRRHYAQGYIRFSLLCFGSFDIEYGVKSESSKVFSCLRAGWPLDRKIASSPLPAEGSQERNDVRLQMDRCAEVKTTYVSLLMNAGRCIIEEVPGDPTISETAVCQSWSSQNSLASVHEVRLVCPWNLNNTHAMRRTLTSLPPDRFPCPRTRQQGQACVSMLPHDEPMSRPRTCLFHRSQIIRGAPLPVCIARAPGHSSNEPAKVHTIRSATVCV